VTTSNPRIQILGIGNEGLAGMSPAARQLVQEAELLVGTQAMLSAATGGKAERLEIAGDLEPVVKRLQAASGRKIVVLASGDPLFYGTARYLCDRLGKDRFEVTPHVSSMQLAFARVKESWDEAYLTNLATQALDLVAEKARTAEKVGLFTTDAAPPSAVAQALLDRKIDYFTAYVCENLGAPDERVTHGNLAEIAEQEFSPLNVMILIRKPGAPDRPAALAGRRLFGNPDELFLQSQPKRGLLTPAEVRAIALAELDLGPSSIVWDIGAGSGSVAIEAAQIASGGQAYAIEMDPQDYQLISANAQRFGVTNLTPILGQAPAAWANLPKPDAVFVGGNGWHVPGIVESAFAELKSSGRMVINVGSLENLSGVRERLGHSEWNINVLMVNLARGITPLERMRFSALNPTFLISTTKK
jgi:precorrin-6Y C5,15-methyltransferase (decarboxylating)